MKRPDFTAHGFTLFELVAVIVVLLLLTSTVAFTMRGHVSNARMEAMVDRLESFDQRIRQDARRHGQVQHLLIDQTRRRLEHLTSDGQRSHLLNLPNGVELLDIKQSQRSQQRDSISFTTRGQSASYALQLRSAHGREFWIVVLGTSGQHLRVKEENHVAQLLSS